MRFTQVIREKIGEILESHANVIAAGITVYNYDKKNISDRSLPAITIVNGTGIYENGCEEITIPYRVELHAVHPTKIQNTLDALAEVVEPILPIATTLDGLVEYMNPESFDYSFDETTGNGKMGLNFNIKYEV